MKQPSKINCVKNDKSFKFDFLIRMFTLCSSLFMALKKIQSYNKSLALCMIFLLLMPIALFREVALLNVPSDSLQILSSNCLFDIIHKISLLIEFIV